MSKQHFIAPVVPTSDAFTVRLGASGAPFKAGYDEGKLVKLTAESRYDLCAAGDPIEAIVLAISTATSGGFSVGSVINEDRAFALADGLQATPGTGTLAIGDWLVAGTATVLNTALASYPKVCKATLQPGADPATTAAAGTLIKQSIFAWRVVSLGTAGTGAVGTTIVMARENM